MKINTYINNSNIENQWVETLNLLKDAEVKVNFWGGRVIKSSNYEGSISLKTVAEKIFCAAQKRNEADDLTPSERIAGIGITKKINWMYQESDSQLQNANWFTKLLNKIREFSIVPYTTRFFVAHSLKGKFSGYSQAKAIQEFGKDFIFKTNGSYGPPLRYKIQKKYILAKCNAAA